MKVWELLSDESKWCTLFGAMNEAGQPVHFNDSDAVQWDLFGAFAHCYWHKDAKHYHVECLNRLLSKISELLNKPQHVSNLWLWSMDRPFSEVRALLVELDI